MKAGELPETRKLSALWLIQRHFDQLSTLRALKPRGTLKCGSVYCRALDRPVFKPRWALLCSLRELFPALRRARSPSCMGIASVLFIYIYIFFNENASLEIPLTWFRPSKRPRWPLVTFAAPSVWTHSPHSQNSCLVFHPLFANKQHQKQAIINVAAHWTARRARHRPTQHKHNKRQRWREVTRWCLTASTIQLTRSSIKQL